MLFIKILALANYMTNFPLAMAPISLVAIYNS